MTSKVLVAIDDSAAAQKALDQAIQVAKCAGASLCIAWVADEASLLQHGMGLGSYIDVDKVRDEMRKAGRQLLDGAAARAAAAGCTAQTRLVEATERRVAEMIVDAAIDWGADLIVVGAHGRRGIERMLVGSVAENLTRISPVSLMLVR